MKLKSSVLSVLSACLVSMASSQVTHITQGGSYNVASYNGNPDSACVYVDTTEPVTISGWFWSAGNGIIAGAGARVTVEHAVFTALNPEVKYKQKGTAVLLNQPAYSSVTNCTFEGWYCAAWALGPGTAEIHWDYNKVLNMSGACSNGEGGYMSTTGQSPATAYQDDGGGGGAFEFQDLTFVPGSDLSWNEITNGESAHCGDAINVFNCQGTPDSYFLIAYNLIEGVVPHDYTAQCTDSAITTDGYPAMGEVCHYIEELDNTAVHCTGGIGFAYGSHCWAEGNTVVSDNLDPKGEHYPAVYCVGVDLYRGSRSDVITGNYSASNFTATTRLDYGEGQAVLSPAYRNNTSLWPGQCVTKEMEKYTENQWRKMINENGITIGAQ